MRSAAIIGPIRTAARWARQRAATAKSRISDLAVRTLDQHRLRPSERHWRRIVESVPQLIWTATVDGVADYFSPQLLNFTGASRRDLGEWGWLDFVHQDERAATREEWTNAVARGSEYRGEYRLRRSDGVYRWLSCIATPVRDERGHLVEWVGVAVDVTDRKTAEERSRRIQRRFDLLTDLTQSSFWEFALRDGLVRNAFVAVEDNLWVGPVATNDFGSILNRGAIFPEYHERFIRAVQACVDGETQEFHVEYQFRHEDGFTRWRHTRGTVVRDANGKVKGFIGAGSDITDLKRANEEIRTVKERLELAVRGSQVSIWDFELQGDAVGQSRLDDASNVWGARGRDATLPASDYASSIKLVVSPEDQNRLTAAIEACVRGETPEFQVEYRAGGYDDGRVHWRLARGTVVRDLEARPLRLVGTSVDISDLKRAEEEARVMEEEVRRAKERLELAVRGSNVAIFEFEMPDARIENSHQTMINVWETLGYEPQNVPTEFTAGALLAVHPDDIERVLDEIQLYLNGTRQRFDVEYRVLHRNGSILWRLARGLVFRDGEGRAVRFIGTFVDITDLKRIEGELQRLTEAAESANRAKDEFLANVSHEIRTPMNAILGMTELALASSHTEHQRQLLLTVKSAATNLLVIIDDLLDFSKIEAGKLDLNRTEFSLRVSLRDTLRALAPRAHAKGLDLTCRVHPDVPDALLGDAGRLRQVLMNLVGNAIKFTAQGEVVVEVTPPEDSSRTDDAILLSFAIHDTGIGIAREKLAAIFRPFEQEDASTTRKYGGTGLGLTISAQLASLMGGAITVESEPGRGSSFTLTARFERSSKLDESDVRSLTAWPPADAPRLPPTSVVTQAVRPSLRVLVAEDNELNVILLSELLSQRGHRAEFARDGQAALTRATEGSFDLLLLDLHMPNMDGFEVVRAIRERERGTNEHLPTIALTARSSQKDRERCLAAGMDDFLSKPIETYALWAAVERVVATLPPIAEEDVPLLDPTAILRLCGGRAEVLERLCDAFRRTLPAHLAQVRAALADGEPPRLSGAAHTLYGTVAAFSTRAAALATSLEERAARGELENCAALVDRLESMCSELLEGTRAITIEQLAS